MTILASIRLLNHSMLRHSSRNLPLNDSFDPFCQGLPGSMLACSSNCSTARDTNSGPLSERICRGLPEPIRDFVGEA